MCVILMYTVEESLKMLCVVDVDFDDLASRVKMKLKKEPVYFAALSETFEKEGFNALARSLGKLHKDGELWQDEQGRLCLANSKFAAKPPPSI